IDLPLHLYTGAMFLREVLHEVTGHSPEGILLFPLLSLLWTNAAMSISHDGFRFRTSIGKTEQIIRWLNSDALILAVDPCADEEGLTPRRSNSHAKAGEQLIPVIDRL